MGLFEQSANTKLLMDIDTAISKLDYKVDEIIQGIKNMATDQATFDAALANLQTTLTSGLATISTALTDLINKIQVGTPGVDLTNELTAVNQMVSNLGTVVTTAKSDDPGPTTPPATPAA